MKLSKFKKTLEEKKELQSEGILKTFGLLHQLTPLCLEESTEDKKLDEVIIIGITGSRGKTTTAYLVHQAIKSLGYRSMLYSSIGIDYPSRDITYMESCERPLKDEEILLDVIYQAQENEIKYIVLEVSERAIQKGIINGIPFRVRALTNLVPEHNKDFYTPKEYFNIKKRFFEHIPDDEVCTSVIGLTEGITKEMFEILLNANQHDKRTYGTKYLSSVRGIHSDELDYLLFSKGRKIMDSLAGLDFSIRVDKTEYDLTTNIILPHNAVNITCAIAILDSLNLFDPVRFQELIQKIMIPGREEIFKKNGKTVIVGFSLIPMLEQLKKYKDNLKNHPAWGGMNEIKVILASPGRTFKSWEHDLENHIIDQERVNARKFAMEYVKQYADYVYITRNDNGGDNPLEIATMLSNYLQDKIPYCIEIDRKSAIRKAILELKENDVLYISGRGNRRVLCESEEEVALFTDKEIVLQALEEME